MATSAWTGAEDPSARVPHLRPPLYYGLCVLWALMWPMVHLKMWAESIDKCARDLWLTTSQCRFHRGLLERRLGQISLLSCHCLLPIWHDLSLMTLQRFRLGEWCRNCKMKGFSQKRTTTPRSIYGIWLLYFKSYSLTILFFWHFLNILFRYVYIEMYITIIRC
jgi:hypothetical protein